VDDMNEMNEATGSVEEVLGSMRRRDFLTKAAAAGALTWAAPVILSRPAFAIEGGSPGCPPEITIEDCFVHECVFQGNATRDFPAISIDVTPCPCDTTESPTVCMRIDNLVSSESDVVAYGDDTNCKPFSQGGCDEILFPVPPMGNPWLCVDPNEVIFFGKKRESGGAIAELGDGATISFRLTVWAGECPNEVGGGTAFTCETYDVFIEFQKNPAPPHISICEADRVTGDPTCTTGFTPPCTCPRPGMACPPL
jgi:hypothetical protein